MKPCSAKHESAQQQRANLVHAHVGEQDVHEEAIAGDNGVHGRREARASDAQQGGGACPGPVHMVHWSDV